MKNFRILFYLSFLLFNFVPGLAIAADEESMGHSVYLSFEDVSRMALKNNFDIQLARYDVRMQRNKKKSAIAIYDTLASAEVAYRNNQSARVSTFAGNTQLDNDYILSLTKKTPFGAEVSMTSSNNRQWSDSVFSTTNPAHNSQLKIGVIQSLGKNFFGLQDRGEVRLVLADIVSSEFASLERIEDQLLAVQRAYVDLYCELQRFKIAKEILEQADKLLKSHQDKFLKGLVEQPALLAAEVNYESRFNDLQLADSQVKSKNNILLLLLNLDDTSEVIVPSTTLDLTFQAQQPPLSELLQSALHNRYDYKKAMNELKINDIKVSLRKNDVFPQINLSASFAQNGISNKDFNDAYNELDTSDANDYSVGIKVSMPLENHQAQAQLNSANLAKARELINIKRLEREITLNVFDQARVVKVNRQLAENAQKIAALEQSKVDAEQKRFNSGRSSTDLIIRYQEDLLDARLKEIQANAQYIYSVLVLEQKTGELLLPYWNEDF